MGTATSLPLFDSNANPPMPNDTKQILETLMAQNTMLMQLLKVQQEKPKNEVTFAPDFQKSIPVYNGLNTGHQALDWLKTVKSVAD